jgi:hypothetical protein
MISGYILGGNALVRKLEAFPVAARAEVDATVMKLGFRLESIVKTKYLRGPRPQNLGVVTGGLLSSITRGGAQSRTRFEATAAKSIYYVGTNVDYGAMWENGFTRKVGAGARGGPRTLKGRALATYMAKHPPGTKEIAARQFLAPALRDIAPLAEVELANALKRAAERAFP